MTPPSSATVISPPLQRRLRESRDFPGFVAAARMIYLGHDLVLFADAEGFDLIGALHARGPQVDAYTVRVATKEIPPKVMRLLALRVDQIATGDPVGLELLVLVAQTGGKGSARCVTVAYGCSMDSRSPTTALRTCGMAATNAFARRRPSAVCWMTVTLSLSASVGFLSAALGKPSKK